MFHDDRWRDSYDAWKLATPPEYEGGDDEEWRCEECGNTGWDESGDDVDRCPRCFQPIEIEDLTEMAGD